jgi:hypothetical protein
MQQKVFIVKQYYKNENTVVTEQIKFCTEFALCKGPTTNTVRHLKQFEETDNLLNQRKCHAVCLMW